MNKEERDQRELDILNRMADYPNTELKDILDYQIDLWKDFPRTAELRAEMGEDVPREPL